VTDEIYTQDGDYIKDIEINDLRNRYTLTKGATQKLVNIHFVTATDAPALLLLGEFSLHVVLCSAEAHGFFIAEPRFSAADLSPK
jgi:hypothetical protein